MYLIIYPLRQGSPGRSVSEVEAYAEARARP